jgi:hypothetical protein
MAQSSRATPFHATTPSKQTLSSNFETSTQVPTQIFTNNEDLSPPDLESEHQMAGSCRNTEDALTMSSDSTSSRASKIRSRSMSYFTACTTVGSVAGCHSRVDQAIPVTGFDTHYTFNITGRARLRIAGIDTEIFEGTEFTLRQTSGSSIDSSTTQKDCRNHSHWPIHPSTTSLCGPETLPACLVHDFDIGGEVGSMAQGRFSLESQVPDFSQHTQRAKGQKHAVTGEGNDKVGNTINIGANTTSMTQNAHLQLDRKNELGHCSKYPNKSTFESYSCVRQTEAPLEAWNSHGISELIVKSLPNTCAAEAETPQW